MHDLDRFPYVRIYVALIPSYVKATDETSIPDFTTFSNDHFSLKYRNNWDVIDRPNQTTEFIAPNNTAKVIVLWLTPAPNWTFSKSDWLGNLTKHGYSVTTIDNDTRYLGGNHALMIIALKAQTGDKRLWVATNINGTQYILSFAAEATSYYAHYFNDFNLMWDTFKAKGGTGD